MVRFSTCGGAEVAGVGVLMCVGFRSVRRDRRNIEAMKTSLTDGQRKINQKYWFHCINSVDALITGLYPDKTDR